MEENIKVEGETQQKVVEETKEEPQSFSNYNRGPKSSNKSSVMLLVFLLLLALVGGFFIVKKLRTSQETIPPETAGSVELNSPSTPTPTAEPIDKTKIKIEVLNGTSISGEAAFLQGQLRNLGYTGIVVGNKERTDVETTEVTFSDVLAKKVVDEITIKFEEVYKVVSVSTSSSLLGKDVQIVTGLRKGQTPKPSPTVTPTPSASPSASPTPTP